MTDTLTPAEIKAATRKFAANLAASLEEAAELLGHSDKRLTATHYRLKVTPTRTMR